jgi:hypothetical protein
LKPTQAITCIRQGGGEATLSAIDDALPDGTAHRAGIAETARWARQLHRENKGGGGMNRAIIVGSGVGD